jgi:hypothetical protein
MSWHFSRALVEEYSAASCSDGEPSALLSGSPTPQAYLSPDRMTAFSRLSRFGMTFAPLTDRHGADLLMWFRAGFHAKTSALQEKAQESTGRDQACGPIWRGSLAKYDPDSLSWKTVQLSLLGDSELSSVIWPRSGMTAAGQCWELPTLERPTSGTGFGWLLPTPCSSDPQLERRAKHGEHYQTQTGTVRRKNQDGTSSNLGLAAAVRMWPTPQASDSRNRGNAGTPAIARRIAAGKQVMLTMTVSGGQLNPMWVEWLMGWPLGWTDLKPSETDRCPNAQPKPGECSQDDDGHPPPAKVLLACPVLRGETSASSR